VNMKSNYSKRNLMLNQKNKLSELLMATLQKQGRKKIGIKLQLLMTRYIK